jgi:hypothetical protein
MPWCPPSPVPGQGRPPGQATGDKHAAVRAGLAGAGPPRGVQPPLPAPQEPPTPPGSQGRAAVGDGVNDQGDAQQPRAVASSTSDATTGRRSRESSMASRGGPHPVTSRLGWSRCLRTGSFVPRSRIQAFGSASERALTSAACGRGGRSGRPPALGPQLDLVWSRRSGDRATQQARTGLDPVAISGRNEHASRAPRRATQAVSTVKPPRRPTTSAC